MQQGNSTLPREGSRQAVKCNEKRRSASFAGDLNNTVRNSAVRSTLEHLWRARARVRGKRMVFGSYAALTLPQSVLVLQATRALAYTYLHSLPREDDTGLSLRQSPLLQCGGTMRTPGMVSRRVA